MLSKQLKQQSFPKLGLLFQQGECDNVLHGQGYRWV